MLVGTVNEGLGELGATLAERCWVAIIATPVVLFVLLAWAVIPFKARPGRRFGPADRTGRYGDRIGRRCGIISAPRVRTLADQHGVVMECVRRLAG